MDVNDVSNEDQFEEVARKRQRQEFEQDDENLSLEQLPEELQRLIVEKFDLAGYCKMWLTNRRVAKICAQEAKKISQPVTALVYEENEFVVHKWTRHGNDDEEDNDAGNIWNAVSQTPFRLKADVLDINGTLTDDLSRYFTHEFQKNGTRAKILMGDLDIECSVEYFNDLLKMTKISMLGGDLELNEDEFLSLNAQEITFKQEYCHIQNADLNAFLKQWRGKQREVQLFGMIRGFTDYDISRIIKDIDANEVAMDSYYLFPHVSELERRTMAISKVFCLFHCDNIEDIYILIFFQEEILFYNLNKASFTSLHDVLL